ncbi:hypothetical protein [Microlunatus ginsengisoli]|uniref:Uncharacterized protein n=1 Tax=Microlunatus ginsengisoli TaxID=363863 RepID=A0ABP7A4F8_9ACTN
MRRSTRHWIGALIGLGLVFVAFRLVNWAGEPATSSAIYTPQVVVVGVTGRYTLSPGDREVLGAHLDDAQAGSMVVRPRYVGDCAAAGWTTLGAGRRAAVGELCDPVVNGSGSDARVADWAAREAAAAANHGDAKLGTLSASVSGCVGAVGPGAALAAARPDGSLAAYATVAQFRAGGAKPACPITLVDAGDAADALVAELADRSDVTVILTGIGPDAGSDDPGTQVVYRLGTTIPGWLTSDSTRREGIVTLTDLTATLIDFGGGAAATSAAVDGSPFAVDPDDLSVRGIERHLAAVTALSDAVVSGYLAVGVGGAVLLAVFGVALWRRRWPLARLIMTVGTITAAAMMLTGSVPWQGLRHPGLAVGLVAAGWAGALTLAALGLSRWLRVPAAIAGAGLTVAAFTADAALGAVMQPGSLLNSRPILGLRWYGFGNVTFAAYAAAGLLLAGYVAHRLRTNGRPRLAVVAVAAIGFGIVLCEGWPSMGTDFGGVIALTPPLLWLLFALAIDRPDARVSWPRLALAGVGAVVLVAIISVLDWRRGPGARSHLGNFVQRIIDGDAFDIVVRKGVASVDTIVSPLGLISLAIGVPLWIGMLRWAVPRVATAYSTIRPVVIAGLAVAILGTLLNDGGISVWLTATGMYAITVAWFVLDGLVLVPTTPARHWPPKTVR